MKIKKYKGVRDFYPEEMNIQNYIYKTWQKTAKSFGFKEIEPPMIEPIELFTIKSGEEIRSQLYNFIDKGNRYHYLNSISLCLYSSIHSAVSLKGELTALLTI